MENAEKQFAITKVEQMHTRYTIARSQVGSAAREEREPPEKKKMYRTSTSTGKIAHHADNNKNAPN